MEARSTSSSVVSVGPAVVLEGVAQLVEEEEDLLDWVLLQPLSIQEEERLQAYINSLRRIARCRHKHCSDGNLLFHGLYAVGNMHRHEKKRGGHCVDQADCPACNAWAGERKGKALDPPTETWRCKHSAAKCIGKVFRQASSASRHMAQEHDCFPGCDAISKYRLQNLLKK